MIPAINRLMIRPTLGRSVKLGPEDRISIEFANRLRVWTIERRLRGVWTHVANEVGGGTKNAMIRYAVAKALGMIPGCSDFIFMWDSGSAAIEMKAPCGVQNDNQSDFQKWCEAEGVPYFIAKSADEAEQILLSLGILK
nr:MAG TPA: Nuclease [Caudoviricetes sp.]